MVSFMVMAKFTTRKTRPPMKANLPMGNLMARAQ